MSLIGPRPERPELEHDLERHIPHYRKRHWMRPGLAAGPSLCALCQQHRGFRSQAFLRSLLLLQHLA